MLKIVVKPNSAKDEILGYDAHKLALRIAIRAKAEDNKANIAIITFFKKKGYVARIIKGLKSKEKLLQIHE